MPNGRRSLIVNADDFGLSAGINAGIIEAHQRGILTSASLMVRWPAAAEAAAYAQTHPELSVGLHVDLGEWTYSQEQWQLAYEVVPQDDPSAVAQEISRQLQAFERLMGRHPTHIDSHQHVHHSEPALSILVEKARALGVVLRGVNPVVRYCGEFYGQSNKGYPYPDGISVESLRKLLQRLPAGCTELGCHPAKAADMQGMYCCERLAECETLCDPSIETAIAKENIVLCSFSDMASDPQY